MCRKGSLPCASGQWRGDVNMGINQCFRVWRQDQVFSGVAVWGAGGGIRRMIEHVNKQPQDSIWIFVWTFTLLPTVCDMGHYLDGEGKITEYRQ